MANSSANPIQEISEAWASVYPLVQWVLDHPFGSLVTAFLSLYLFWGLLRGLIHLTENLWVKLLQSPIWVVQRLWLWTGIGRSPFKLFRNDSPSRVTECDRLQALVNELEAANKAQQELIYQAKELLSQMNRLE